MLFSIYPYISLLRPSQWVKNLLVFSPMVFAGAATEINSILYSSVAFFLFCLNSGSVYILNDYNDIQRDRIHPTKRLRPLASGEISKSASLVFLVVILSLMLTGASLLSVNFLLTTLGYFSLNILYTFRLKHVPWLDIISISTGFILRILAGAVAVGVSLSMWLIVNTFFLAALLGFGKRYHELLVLGSQASETRPVLAFYKLKTLRDVLRSLPVIISLSFLGWCFAPDRLSGADPLLLALTTPVITFALYRFYLICSSTESKSSPTENMLKDIPLIIASVIWSSSIILIFYFI
ncbi:MAG: UbiA prenyltransferase family protein [Deltaproteobacteria bacterium]|nr:UbiA prenyltransferase family protein [Deltaproteobacteria bacterium]